MSENKCVSKLATRPILYTDTLGGVLCGRDYFWAVKTCELNAQEEELARLRSENEVLKQNKSILKTVDEIEPGATQYVEAVLLAVDRAEKAEKRAQEYAAYINVSGHGLIERAEAAEAKVAVLTKELKEGVEFYRNLREAHVALTKERDEARLETERMENRMLHRGDVPLREENARLAERVRELESSTRNAAELAKMRAAHRNETLAENAAMTERIKELEKSPSDTAYAMMLTENAALTANLAQMREVVEAAKELREYVRRKAHGLDPVNPIAGRFDAALSRLTDAPERCPHHVPTTHICSVCKAAPEGKPCACAPVGMEAHLPNCPKCCPPSPGKGE